MENESPQTADGPDEPDREGVPAPAGDDEGSDSDIGGPTSPDDGPEEGATGGGEGGGDSESSESDAGA